MNLHWLSVSARDGTVLADLPGLDVASVKRSMGMYEPVPVSLPLPTAPNNWEEATIPGGCNLILLDDETILWGGMILKRPRTEGNTVELPTATIEAYMDRRFVGDTVFTGIGQDLILASLVEQYVADELGIPMRVEFTSPGGGKLRDRTYADVNDKTVYSALTDFTGIIAGPEWNCEWEWGTLNGRRTITPVMQIGGRVGKAVTPGLGADATFEMPGSVSTFMLLEDYSADKGANDVMATSTGVGDVRPQSSHWVAQDETRPKFEFRWSPSSSIVLTETLDDYGQIGRDALAQGTNTLTLTADYESAPPLGKDWRLGDDVGYVIGSGVPSFPRGQNGVARAIGWELSLGPTPQITPVLALPEFKR